jgi:hypothetical protein
MSETLLIGVITAVTALMVGLISAISALAGVVVSQFFEYKNQEKSLKLRLWERLLDRRIEAHDQMALYAKTLRHMKILDYQDENGEPARTPACLMNDAEFIKWWDEFSGIFERNSTWLSTTLTREVNLLQDYVVNLKYLLQFVEPDNYPKVGAILRDDFVQLSSNIENVAFEFFTTDLSKLRLNNIKEWHKYPRQETEKRLQATNLFSRRDEINNLIQQQGKPKPA